MPSTLGSFCLSCLAATLGESAVQRVFDAHVHSLSDWENLDYAYPKGSIFDHNWTYADYVKASHPSALPPTDFLFMSLGGVSSEQYLLQCQLAERQAQQVETSGGSPRSVGLVAAADLAIEPAAMASYLTQLLAEVPSVVGLRPMLIPFADPRLGDVLREVQSRGLVLNALVYDVGHLTYLSDIARALPDLSIVLGHLGFYAPTGGPLPDREAWASNMTLLATNPNVYVEISGGTALAMGPDAKDILKPLVEHTVKEFGYDRSIYSGNWFVVEDQEGFYSYRAWAQAVTEYLDGLNATSLQRDQLLYQAGMGVYAHAGSDRLVV